MTMRNDNDDHDKVSLIFIADDDDADYYYVKGYRIIINSLYRNDDERRFGFYLSLLDGSGKFLSTFNQRLSTTYTRTVHREEAFSKKDSGGLLKFASHVEHELPFHAACNRLTFFSRRWLCWQYPSLQYSLFDAHTSYGLTIFAGSLFHNLQSSSYWWQWSRITMKNGYLPLIIINIFLVPMNLFLGRQKFFTHMSFLPRPTIDCITYDFGRTHSNWVHSHYNGSYTVFLQTKR